ncbi:hypothetical protein CYY_004402 [Polysphondylium violaceum]|uniref:Protein kinase domain-containing protein n=1 Tax=Polysphondylium violaceum TaxID=133409 RepID=A0A8J4PX27_9MYCE|nr:hypothetical protein CYY_004402 [Polysphondylium violaceum]
MSSNISQFNTDGPVKDPSKRRSVPANLHSSISHERRESIIRELQKIPTSNQYPNTAEDYQLLEPIGEGTEGKVWKAHCISLNEDVAIKVVELERMDPAFVKDVIKEAKVMNGNNHPNLIHYHTSFLTDSSLWIVMDYLGGGSLADIIKYKYPNGLPEVLAITILKALLKGLEYLHSHQRIHRDLKSDNILIGDDGSIELADFGVTAIFEKNCLCSRKTIVGTPCWMAPEIISEKGYNQSVDMWSFGITAIELIKGKPPGSDLPPSKVFMNLLFGNSPSLAEEEERGECSHAYRDMVDKCLQKEPSRRPSASKLLEHKVFKYAKKSNYIVSNLLHNLSPCEDRYRESLSQEGSLNSSPNSSRPSSPDNYSANTDSPKSPIAKSCSSIELKNRQAGLPQFMPRAASHPVDLQNLEFQNNGTNSNSNQHIQHTQIVTPPSATEQKHQGFLHHKKSNPTSPEKERKKGFFNHFRRHSIAKLFGSPKDDHHKDEHHKEEQPTPHHGEQHHHFHFPWKHHHSPSHVEST